MITDKYAVIVPASDRNRYSADGDLAKFGNTTLLEWKIDQLKAIFSEKNLFVSTSSERVKRVIEETGVATLTRAHDLDIPEVIASSVDQVPFENIVWTNVTSPFLDASEYLRMIEKFSMIDQNKMSGYDCVLSAERLSEYLYFKGTALNFDLSNHQSRSELEPVYRLTNGCAILKKENCKTASGFFGKSPLFHEVSRLAALEIKDFEFLHIASDLISLYFKRVLSV